MTDPNPLREDEVEDEAFARILAAIDNPPAPSAELIALVARGRAMRLDQVREGRGK